MESNQQHFRSIKFCTCRFHKINTSQFDMPLLYLELCKLITDVMEAPPLDLHKIVFEYLTIRRNPNALFLEFLVSPYIKHNATRKLFITRLWQLLLRKRNTMKSFIGGVYCSRHGLRLRSNSK